jgi:hypothetical protein
VAVKAAIARPCAFQACSWGTVTAMQKIPLKTNKKLGCQRHPSPQYINTTDYFLVILGGSLKKMAKKNSPIVHAKIRV